MKPICDQCRNQKAEKGKKVCSLRPYSHDTNTVCIFDPLLENKFVVVDEAQNQITMARLLLAHKRIDHQNREIMRMRSVIRTLEHKLTAVDDVNKEPESDPEYQERMKKISLIPDGMTCNQCTYFKRCEQQDLTEGNSRNCAFLDHKFKANKANRDNPGEES